MKKLTKLISAALCATILIPTSAVPATAADTAVPTAVSEPIAPTEDNAPFDVDATSAVLMELSTGTVLYSKNATEALPPASVTKIMTLLLTMEAIDGGQFSLQDQIQISDYASSMGGSQVYLKAGESMSVEDLLKSTVIASANDAAVALAEKVAGSVEAFVSRMNERAAQLGMTSTHFENPTGLDDDVTNHVTSAYDIAVMSRELMKHETIMQYTSIWMDTIRDGAFGLTNTNRLIRFYNGATGLKTGSTAKAKFCISATAKRDGMHLCAVIMGSPTRDIRNESAKTLLDWGFANYFIYSDPGAEAGRVPVVGGVESDVSLTYGSCELLLPMSKRGTVEVTLDIPAELTAPVKTGECVGKVVYSSGGETVAEGDVVAASDVPKISYGEILRRICASFLLI